MPDYLLNYKINDYIKCGTPFKVIIDETIDGIKPIEEYEPEDKLILCDRYGIDDFDEAYNHHIKQLRREERQHKKYLNGHKATTPEPYSGSKEKSPSPIRDSPISIKNNVKIVTTESEAEKMIRIRDTRQAIYEEFGPDILHETSLF